MYLLADISVAVNFMRSESFKKNQLDLKLKTILFVNT